MQLYTSIEARRQVRASWKKQERYIYILLTETRRKKHKTGEPSSDHGDGARSHCHHRKPLFLAVHCIHLRRKFSGRLAPPHARGDDNDEQGETNEIWNGEATSLLQHFSCHWLWHAVNSLLDNQTFNFSFVPDFLPPIQMRAFGTTSLHRDASGTPPNHPVQMPHICTRTWSTLVQM